MTLNILLQAYMILMVIFIIAIIINVLHIVFLTVTDRISYFVTTLCVLAFIIIMAGSLRMMDNIDWNQPLVQSYNPTSNPFEQ